MLTNAAAPALLARTPLSAMLTNAAAPAILALAPLSAMLTNAAAPALLAHTHPSAMLTTVLPCFLFGWHFERNLYRRVALFLESVVLFAAAAATNEQSHGAAEARGGRAKKRQVTN
jgi:hypothetical protein